MSALAVGVTVGARLLSGNVLLAAGIDRRFAHRLSVGLPTTAVGWGVGLLALNVRFTRHARRTCQT